MIRRHFEPKGYSVLGAASAEEGMTLLDSQPFDAVILDIVLPGISGLRALSELRRRSQIPIFVITGHADAELEKDALLLGAEAFLAKPIDFHEMALRLEAALSA